MMQAKLDSTQRKTTEFHKTFKSTYKGIRRRAIQLRYAERRMRLNPIYL